MRGEFKLPTKMSKPNRNQQQVVQQSSSSIDDNDVYSTPYQVRVRPPADFVAPSSVDAAAAAAASPTNDENDSDSDSESTAENQSKTLILRLGRSLPSSVGVQPLNLLPEQEAQWLSTRFVL